MTLKIRCTWEHDGEIVESLPLDWIVSNVEDPAMSEWVDALSRGETVRDGGGACPMFTLEAVETAD